MLSLVTIRLPVLTNAKGLDATQAYQASQDWGPSTNDQPSAPCPTFPDKEHHAPGGKSRTFPGRGGCTTDGSSIDIRNDQQPSQQTQSGNFGSPPTTGGGLSSSRRSLDISISQVSPNHGSRDSSRSSHQWPVEGDEERFRQTTTASLQSASSSVGVRSPRQQLKAGRRQKKVSGIVLDTQILSDETGKNVLVFF